MSDEPKRPPLVECIPSLEGTLSGLASADAPFIYFEDAPGYGVLSHTLRITLTASRIMPISNQEVKIDHVVVAHLRMNVVSARILRDTLDKAIQAAETADKDKAN